MDEKKPKKERCDQKIEGYMEMILLEIRWIRNNLNPPVNYFLVAVLSIISAAITTIMLTH